MSTKLATVHISKREMLTLAILLGAQFMLAVDFSILNVALPTIGTALSLNIEGLQWVATLFSLMAASLTLFFGRVADIIGRRKLFLSGVILLGLGSLAGGLAHSLWLLLVARSAQGVATAMVTPSALALLTASFPEGPLRDRALGLNGALLAAGFTTGSIAGGLLTSFLNWRSAFFVNVPIALIITILGPFLLRESKHRQRQRLDMAGVLTITTGLLSGLYAISRFGVTGFTDIWTYGWLGLAAVLLRIFIQVERRASHPLVSLHILRHRLVRWGNLVGLIAFVTETSLVFLTTLYLQTVMHLTALGTGLTFLSIGLSTFLGGILGAKIIDRFGARKVLIGGLGVQGLATALLIVVGASTLWIPYILVVTAVGGFANMLSIVAFMVAATSSISDADQGAATGMASMSQLIGISIGIPVMSAVFSGFIHVGHSHFLHAFHSTVVVNAMLCILTALVVRIYLKRGA